jgi:hypothetical protein
MARKKTNPYEDFGLQAAGLMPGPANTTASSGNAYEDFGQNYAQHAQRDPTLIWDYSKPADNGVQATVKTGNDNPQQKQPPKRSLPARLASDIADVFSANSQSDQQKREAAGQPRLYQDQQKQQKQQAQDFTKQNQDQFQRGAQFNLSKDEIDARRTFYKQNGLDIDQLVKYKIAYDSFIDKVGPQNVGKPSRQLAQMAKNGTIPKDAQTFQRLQGKAKQVESNYRAVQTQAAGADSTIGQAERGFVRGFADPLLQAPSSVETIAGAGVKAIAPGGSRLDKAGGALEQKGITDQNDLATRMVSHGLGLYQNDNQLVTGVAQGVGSLAASLAAAQALRATSAAAGLFGLNQGAQQTTSAKQAGKGDIQTFATGVAGGIAEGGLEKLGLDKFLGAKGGPVKEVITRMLTEGAQEAAQSLAQSGINLTYSHVDLQNAIQQAVTQGGLGALVGGGAGLPMSIADHLESKGVPHEQALNTGLDVADKVEKVLTEARKQNVKTTPQTTETGTPTDQQPNEATDQPGSGPAAKNPGTKTITGGATTSAAIPSLTGEAGPTPLETPSQFADRYVKENPIKVTADYQARVMKEFGVSKPNVASGDEAKFVIPGFKTAHSDAYHPPASQFAKDYYKQLLADPTTKHESVLITGGGAGAGKSTGLQAIEEAGGNLSKFAAINDTNLTTVDAAESRIKPALESGRKVKILYVYRDPVEAFTNGNVPRAVKTGRVVPLDAHIDTHVGSLETIKHIAEKYKDNPNVQIQVVDNSRGKGQAVLESVDFLKNKSHNIDKLRKDLSHELEAAKAKGHVSEEAYNAYTRHRSFRPTVRESTQPKSTEKPVAKADYASVKNHVTGQTAGSFYKDFGAQAAQEIIKGRRNDNSRIEAIKQGKNVIATAENEKYRLYVSKYKGGTLGKPTIFVEDRATGRIVKEMFWMGTPEPGFPKNFNSLPISERARLEAQYKLDHFYQDSKSYDAYRKLEDFDNAVTQVHKQATGTTRQPVLAALANYHDKVTGRESALSAAELVQMADRLNKAGQAGAILRRGDLKSKKAWGMFSHKGGGKDAAVKLQDAVIKDPRMYATVLAHELSHAIEFYVNGGSNRKTYALFGKLTKQERLTIQDELKAIVQEVEGKAIAESNPTYYYKPTEMLARYFEVRVLHPGLADSMAPTVTTKIEELAAREPTVQNLIDAIEGSLDKGFRNYTPDVVKDMRQTYRKKLGKLAGDVAYNAEVQRRAEVQRSSALIERLVKRKFKGVKDKPDLLFKAAEAILVTEHEQPQFGTTDYVYNVKPGAVDGLAKQGWKVESKLPVSMHTNKAGETIIEWEYTMGKARYTPQEAEAIYNRLSDNGKKLIRDFTAAKTEAKDEFNRELMKDLYHIDSKLEGWVHHYFAGTPLAANKNVSLRTRTAAARKHRAGAEGYIEDFQKATTKALLELDRAEINNAFISKQLARISKPIAKGDKPEPGWVEVIADGKGGLRLPGEGQVTIIKGEGSSFKLPQRRYQVPEALARHYREIRDVPAEANKAAIALNRLAKYWAINVLIHPGTTSTNFISGGLQYGAKIMNDFYLDLFTANFGLERTRHNLIAPLAVLLPKGWSNAPDWLYGGYRSTLVGQYASPGGDSSIDRGLDQYGNKMLKVFSLVETYWKKTIAISEGSKLSGATNRRIVDRLNKDEQAIVAALNEAIDTYAFDYDNKPLWLEKFDAHGGKLVKPFMTYPYKLGKFYTGHVAAAFDKTLPWEQRASKILTITTIVAFIAMAYNDREKKQKTPEGTAKTPLSLKPGGRVLIGTAKTGEELFIRTAKYPFFNLTSAGKAVAKGHGQELLDMLNEQIGSVGPLVDLFNLATGRRDQFSQYTPPSALVGQMAGEWIPGFRILNDVGQMMDHNQRAPKNFVQGIGSQLPIWGSEEQRAKLRGDPRTIDIPDESAAGRPLNKKSTTTRDVTKPPADILLSLLTGIYVRRINPEEAKKQQLREIRNDAADRIRSELMAGNEADANALAQEYGLTIPKGTYVYYRAQRKKSTGKTPAPK